ncbi:hypothetical protein JAAARDRAFT_260681 [Jaapia argillacea MUCL 33604]|uniref:F-box domain-containing protein n=1 Tax=Jaapia argillacea MUCL 33604 TaxID=933084 RepID=A0A067PU00_9AGAM|nr:hypothetical protein JAAARDRAFT_260681 [Jaapia argillacea MUCL 33604]
MATLSSTDSCAKRLNGYIETVSRREIIPVLSIPHLPEVKMGTLASTKNSNVDLKPFLEALRSNSTSFPGVDLSSKILRAENDINAFNARMEELQQGMDHVSQQLELARRHREVFASFSSPIRRLPPEILAKIFIMARAPITHLDPIEDPFMHVCVYWRQIGFSPETWSDIEAKVLIDQKRTGWSKLDWRVYSPDLAITPL